MTSLELESLLFEKANKYIAGSINGKVYKSGLRPMVETPNLHKEDAVVGVLTGTGNELQKGSCYVNVYIPDKEVNGGLYLADKSRLSAIASLLDSLPAEFRKDERVYFQKSDMILVFEEPQLREHFVSLKLDFKVLQTY